MSFLARIMYINSLMTLAAFRAVPVTVTFACPIRARMPSPVSDHCSSLICLTSKQNKNKRIEVFF
jgi:hypothetical protein